MSAASMSKFLTQVKVSMAPFAPSSKTAKIFLSRIITSDSVAANPALKIVTDSHADVSKPATINVTYKDGKTLNLKASDMKVDDVLRQVGKHARKLQEKEDASS
ncbi:39S ribosomal protein L44, mitochondrial [Entomortierella lignicola]|nr:39S ribosomal protein L44, mitochondrial [Entomortierella lignicola]